MLLLTTIFLLSVLSLETNSEIVWKYQTVQNSGKFCPQKDSCRYGRGGRGPQENDWKSRNCFCDPECSIYGDCCIDAPTFSPDQQRDNFNKFTCLQLREYGHIYVRSVCEEGWTDSDIQDKCLQNDKGDPFGSTLVTSTSSNITYRNYYCAACNSDSKNIKMWTQRLECPTLQGYQARFQNISTEYLYKNLKKNPNSGQWGVELDNIGIPVFHDCFLDPYLPDELTNVVRKCNPDNITASCPDTFLTQQNVPGDSTEEGESVESKLNLTRSEIGRLCESYTAVMYSSKRDRTYRNPHCGVCDSEDLDQLICLNLNIMGRSGLAFMQRFNPISFAVLFDIDRSDGLEVGIEESRACDQQELWDPFFKKCRNIVCGQEGKVFQDGVCYNENELPTTTTTTTTSTSTITTTTTTTTSITTTTTTTSTSTTTVSPVVENDFVEVVTDDDGDDDGDKTSITFPDDQQISALDKIDVVVDETNGTGSISFPGEEDVSSEDDAPSVNVPKDKTTTSTTSTTTGTTTSRTTTTKRFVTTTTTTTPRTTTTYTTSTSTTPLLSGRNDSVEMSPLLSTCTRIELNKDEYRMVSGRVIIDEYKLKLEPGHFVFQGDDLVICAPDELSTKFSPIMGYVTFICLGLSMVCLVFHLLVTLIAPELQNLSGKNLFSFALALLGSYGCFLANMLAVDLDYELCFVLAILMYYFYLAVFCWMLNIALNVAKTLKLATTQLRLSSGAQWGRFAVNCVVGWLLPAVIVAGVAVIDRLDIPEIPFQFKPGFGNSQIGLCWFSSRDALLIYFVAPFSLIMLLNVVSFTTSSCLVWESSRSTAKITATGPRISLFLYVRLALLMGLTWVSGLVAGLVDLEPVWYVFLVLNTLQGLFILLFFTCSKKVVTSVKERLSPASTSDTDSSLWKWRIQEQGDSQDSNLSNSGAALTKHRSNYEQYHKYDQRYYSP